MAADVNQCLPGFNHNVRHGGKQYHVQTEDSGTANPHVITHLFLGGNILASKKASYADLLGEPELAARVRKLMEAQHKEMLRELVRGAFDAVESERTARARAWAPGQLAVEAPPAPTPAPAAKPPPAPSPANGAVAAKPPVAAAVAKPPPAPAPKAPADGWGPPVLPRVARPPPPVPKLDAVAVPGKPAPDRGLDELILSYLAGDQGSKRER